FGGSRRELDRRGELDVGLAHSDACAFDRESLDDRLRHGARESFEEAVAAAVRHGADAVDDLPIVGGELDPVGGGLVGDVVPVVEFGSPRSFPSELLREEPTSTGRPSAAISSSRRTSSKFCSTVLPNPIPGSRQIRSSAIPASTAKRRRSSRNAATSATTS